MSNPKPEKAPDWHDLPALLTVPEMARVLRVGQNAIYNAVRCNELPHIKIGGRISIPKAKLMEMLGVRALAQQPQVRERTTIPPRPGTLQGGKVLPLPNLKPIPVDRFDAEFVQALFCGAEMPDGSLWLQDEDGAQITVGLEGSEVSQSLVHITVRRKPRLKDSRRRPWSDGK